MNSANFRGKLYSKIWLYTMHISVWLVSSNEDTLRCMYSKSAWNMWLMGAPRPSIIPWSPISLCNQFVCICVCSVCFLNETHFCWKSTKYIRHCRLPKSKHENNNIFVAFIVCIWVGRRNIITAAMHMYVICNKLLCLSQTIDSHRWTTKNAESVNVFLFDLRKRKVSTAGYRQLPTVCEQ